MCYMIAVGKNASADGSVMVARNCDSVSTDALRVISVPRQTHEPGSTVRIPAERLQGMGAPEGVIPVPLDIPQVPVTYAYTAIVRATEEDGLHLVLGGINEHQVSAGASSGGWTKPEVNKLTPWLETVIGDHITTLVLQRCRTAREAVTFLGRMSEEYGARTDNYIVSDPQEAWLFEQYQGRHWAAARVPDDSFVVEANSFRLEDPRNPGPSEYLCSSDLVEFATAHGLWDSEGGQPFSAAKAYGTDDINRQRGSLEQPYYSLHRIWRGNMLLKPSARLDPYEPAQRYPLFLQPDNPLTVQDIFRTLSDYYQGTELDEYSPLDEQYPTVIDPETGHYRYAPGWCKSRIIGCPQTVTSWVTQSRAWLSDAVGGVLWAGLGATAASPHVPWYCQNTRDSPRLPDRGSWRTRRLFTGVGVLGVREYLQHPEPLLPRYGRPGQAGLARFRQTLFRKSTGGGGGGKADAGGRAGQGC